MTVTEQIKAKLSETTKLAEGATKGPWDSGQYLFGPEYTVDTRMKADPHNITYSVHCESDAAFMAAARTALPARDAALLVAVDTLYALTRWRDARDESRSALTDILSILNESAK